MGITRTVWILSLVSLFTDVASEMLYPIMPIYLKSIHFSIVLIGVLEGFAEATAGLSKGYFGNLSDITGKRLPFVRWGYMLSALSKPMMAVFTFPWWIFSARTLDRFGKGLRTGARDAILSGEATNKNKGAIFGFHRSMDTCGAIVGPLLALIFLYYYPGSYKALFFLAFIPGVFAIAFTFLLKDKPTGPKKVASRTGILGFLKFVKTSSGLYKKLVLGLLFFALFNSSDVFLLLKIKEGGASDTVTVGVYVFYNLIYALAAYPLGILADRLGLKKVFVLGLMLFALVYFLMPGTHSLYGFAAIFAVYGIYAAASEGIAKAWISNAVDAHDTATAIGSYTGFQSICSLLASSLTGFIWFKWGSSTAFYITALATGITIFYFIVIVKPVPSKTSTV